MGLIDTHAHLTFPELSEQVADVLARCDEAGVDRVVTIGTDLADAREAIALAQRHPTRISAAGGFHPHEAGKVTDEDIAAMAELWAGSDIVAFGEMGLDYHYDFADRQVQKDVFAHQIELAKPHDRPLIIHCREAFPDLVPILLAHGFADRRVVFHCFTGTADEAAVLAAHGWRLSFTGIVTFKGSTELQSIARAYPTDALMVETDSPYLSPVPVRSKRPNEPANVAHTARFLAELRGVAYEQLVEQTSHNARAFFGL